MPTDEYNKLVMQLIEEVRGHEFPPRFAPEKWEWNRSQCYGYCLNAYGVQLGKFGIVLPGFLTQKINPMTIVSLTDIICGFADDVEKLGGELIPCENQFAPPREDGYKVAIYISEQLNDLHFRRQDADGGWSEKPGWFGEIRRVPKEELNWYYDSYDNIRYRLLSYVEIVKK